MLHIFPPIDFFSGEAGCEHRLSGLHSDNLDHWRFIDISGIHLICILIFLLFKNFRPKSFRTGIYQTEYQRTNALKKKRLCAGINASERYQEATPRCHHSPSLTSKSSNSGVLRLTAIIVPRKSISTTSILGVMYILFRLFIITEFKVRM